MSRVQPNPKTIVMHTSDIFDRWGPRVLVAMIILVPLFFQTELYDTYDLPKLALVYVADLILTCLWLWQWASCERMEIKRTSLDLPLFLFLGVGMLSTIGSLDRSLSLWGSYRTYIFGLIPMTTFALLYWFTAQAATSRLVRNIFWAALVCGACVGSYALLQYLGLEFIPGIPTAQGERAWSSLGNPLYVGAVCAMAIALGLSRWSTGSLMAVAITFLGLLNSLSRSAWLGTAGAVFYLLAAMWQNVRFHRNKVMMGLLVIGSLALAFPGVRGRLALFASMQDGSNAARVEGWKAGLSIVREHLWLGSGPDTFFQAFRPHRSLAYIRVTGNGVTQAHAHNELIQMASTEGLLGLVAYLGLLFMVGRQIFKIRATSASEVMGVSAALIALWIQDQFNFSSVATCAWAAIFAGLLFAVGSGIFTKDEKPHVYSISCANPSAARIGVALIFVVGLWVISIPIRADWQYKQGLAWDQGAHYLEALPHLREACRLNGRIGIYQSERANAARSAGLWDEAWETACSVPRRHPYDPDAWNNQGVAAMWMIQLAGHDRWQEAKVSFENAVRLDPVFVDAWANLAKWQHLQGHADEEKRLWQKVLELDPHHIMAKQILGVQ